MSNVKWVTPEVKEAMASEFNQSGSKYLREMKCLVDGKADVYAVLDAFAVICPARQHAIKKLLCSGLRGKGDTIQDLQEARDAIDRAIQMESVKRMQVVRIPPGCKIPADCVADFGNVSNVTVKVW